MTALRIFLARLRGLLGGDRTRDRELRAEIDAHIAEAAEDFARQGVPAAEARRLAFAKFGGVTQTIEAHRERRRFRPLGGFGQDLAYGARMLVKSPGFTLAAVLTRAIGILANTTTISAVNAVLFRPLAIDRPAQVHQIFTGGVREVDGDTGEDASAKFSYPVYKTLRESATMFDGLLATWLASQAMNVAPSATSYASYAGRRRGEIVSGNYFSLLGVPARQGRLLADDDDRTPDAHPVVVLSETFWKAHLDSDPNVVGRLVKIGIRMALGAGRGHVIGLVAGQGMLVTTAGIGVGLAGAFAVTRYLESMLFGLSPFDPPTVAGVSILLAVVAALAIYIPARRATRVDPMVALRHE